MQLTRRTLLATAPLLVAAVPAARPRAVLELFTSQGCSSCPAADRLAASLAADPTLLVVSRPVDYWDRLGWKDSFAQHAFTERQVFYAGARGDGEVYTPQVVVDGQRHAVGSDRAGILALTGDTLPLTVDVAAGAATARVSGDAAPGMVVPGMVVPGMVVAWWLSRSRTVAIGRGENAHASVTYVNVVVADRVIGAWTGAPETYALGPAPNGADTVAVVVQSGTPARPGAIRGGTATVPVA